MRPLFSLVPEIFDHQIDGDGAERVREFLEPALANDGSKALVHGSLDAIGPKHPSCGIQQL